MKRFILSLVLGLVASVCFAQFESDSIANKELDIPFITGSDHSLIWKLLRDRNTPDAINYLNQLLPQRVTVMVGGKPKRVIDTSKVMPVRVSYGFVITVYNDLGSYQEKITASDNADLKKVLLNYLKSIKDAVTGVPVHWPLLAALGVVNDANTAHTEALRQSGKDELEAYKEY